jgi:hypothetical protein
MALTSKQAEMAALLAASGAAVSKQVFLRDPPPGLMLSRIRPTGPSELPRLFSRTEETVEQRVSRLSSAALLYSIDKTNKEPPRRLLRNTEDRNETDVLAKLHSARLKYLDTDRSCPHCRLFTDALYCKEAEQKRLPPIQVVNHHARVNVSFDPETCISEATLKNFQVIVPEALARKLIEMAHPLNWAKHEGSLFEEIVAVDAEGRRLVADAQTRSLQAIWEQRLDGGERPGFIYEHFALPINETIKSSAENIIRISEFEKGPDGYSLSYGYSLERCLRSNFGIAWEPSGLDVDGGGFKVEAVPLSKIVENGRRGSQDPLAQIQRRDLLDIEARLARVASAEDTMRSEGRDYDQELYEGWYANRPASPDQSRDQKRVLPDYLTEEEKGKVDDVVTSLKNRLEQQWGGLSPFYLLTINASKELHFTLPENGPIELWYLMTWMAPAALFMFLNRLCQAPHFLLPHVMQEIEAERPREIAYV